MGQAYRPRIYRVVKAHISEAAAYLVVAEDLDDPDLWALINRFETALEAHRYVAEVEARNRMLAAVAGCRA